LSGRFEDETRAVAVGRKRKSGKFPHWRHSQLLPRASEPQRRPIWPRITIRSGEESVVCSTALPRRGFTSADFQHEAGNPQG
jgi:hypothetical protein